MSAFLCDSIHLSAVVDILLSMSGDPTRAKDPAVCHVLFNSLLDENIKSLLCLYEGRHYSWEDKEGMEYTSQDVQGALITIDKSATARAYQALKCYQYQACEHPEFEASLEAQMIHEALVYLGQFINKDSKEFKEAPWGWEPRPAENIVEFKALAKDPAEEKAQLIADYPHLEPEGTSKRRGATLAAENIRRELKAAFPGIKFSVRSQSFANGNSVDADWIDGPTECAVRDILDKYKQGTFDGMTDCYEYRHSAWLDTFGSTKYVGGNRKYSDCAIEGAIDAVRKDWGMEGPRPSVEDWKKGKLWNTPLNHQAPDHHWNLQNQVGKWLQERDGAAWLPLPEASWQINEIKGGVEIIFPAAPAPEVREALKAAGFRWSKAAGLWWSKRSEDAEAIARQLVAHVCLCGA